MTEPELRALVRDVVARHVHHEGTSQESVPGVASVRRPIDVRVRPDGVDEEVFVPLLPPSIKARRSFAAAKTPQAWSQVFAE